MTGPYAAAALTYRAAGWTGVLPLPPRTKCAPPAGTTGIDGRDPSGADVYAWTESHGRGNVALRLPDTVVGLDVDAYDDRGGGETLARAEARWGALPATWRVTSRDDGLSGIRLYRIPAGLRLLGTFGAGTEVVQHAHRYVVAAPSVHPSGAVYEWHGPDGETGIARPDQLPPLPVAWVDALTVAARRGRSSRGTRRPTPRPAAPAEPAVERLARRTGAHDPAWIVAQLDDHLRQLRKAATRGEVLDYATAVGYLAAQATELDLVNGAELAARIAVAIHRVSGTANTSAIDDAMRAGRTRAHTAPWRLIPA